MRRLHEVYERLRVGKTGMDDLSRRARIHG